MQRFLTVLACAAALAACSALRGPQPVAAGQPFPRLTFEALDGTPAILTPAAGKVTFVNVFATWCPPCKAETPDLAAFAKATAGKVDVVGIDQQESPDQVRAFAARYGMTYPLMIDAGRETKDVLGARIIPRTIAIDASGNVAAIVSGPMTAAQMRDLAAKAGATL